MAELEKMADKPKPWERLALLITIFATLPSAPTVFKNLNLKKIIPQAVKSWLLQYGRAEFWISISFICFTTAIYYWWVHPLRDLSRNPQSSREERIQIVVAGMEKARRRRIIRSLGISWVRDKLLDRFWITTYGTFQRQSNWPSAPDLFDSIDRINFTDGTGKEYQYPRNFEYLKVRSHPAGVDAYSNFVDRSPTFSEASMLFFASNIFPFWLPFFLLKKFKKVLFG